MLLAYTIYTKITHPEKPFMDCIPFMSDFQQNNAKDVTAKANDSEVPATPLKVATSEPKISNNKTETPKSSVPPAPKPKNVAKKQPKAKATPSKTKTTKAKATKRRGDNIKKINGIGPVFEKKLNSIGVNKFEHIAAWSHADADRIDEQLDLSGRPQREDWIAKAKILAAEKNA